MVHGEVAILTNVELEHTEILGKTRAVIAGEKAGILKPGATLVTTLAAGDEAGRVAQATAEALGCRILRVDVPEEATIEETNVALAAEALDELGRRGVMTRAGKPLSADLLDAGARTAAHLVGRMDRIDVAGVPVVFDGAHVPFNIARVLHDLSLLPDLAGPCVAVVALASDKDAAGFIGELGRKARHIVFTELPSSNRGRPATELAALAASLGLEAETEPDPHRAFRRGLALAHESGAWLLVTGSLYLVGALRGDEAPL